MRLAKLTEFRRLFYTPDSAPSLTTLRKNIDKIPGGCKMMDRFYVDLDEFDRATNLRQRLEERQAELAASLKLAGLL